MISKKLMDEHFNWYPTIQDQKFYHLYSKTEPGVYTRNKYFGHITLEKGVATHVFSGKSTKNIDELIQICKEWCDSLPFNSDTYNIDYVRGYKEEMQVREYLQSIGFEMDKDVYRYSGYSHNLSSIVSGSDFVKLTVKKTAQSGESEDDSLLEMSVLCGNSSWIDFPPIHSTEEAIEAINSILGTIYIEITTKAASTFIKMNDKKMDKEKFEKLIIKQVDNSLNIHHYSLKDTLISMLENELKRLKEI